jgi:hypothetical protein
MVAPGTILRLDLGSAALPNVRACLCREYAAPVSEFQTLRAPDRAPASRAKSARVWTPELRRAPPHAGNPAPKHRRNLS